MKMEEKKQRILSGVHEKIQQMEQSSSGAPAPQRKRVPRWAVACCCILIAAILLYDLVLPSGQIAPPSSSALAFYSAKEVAEEEVSALPEQFIQSTSQLGAAMLQELYAEKNTVVSPVSLQLPLLMAREGARGETEQQITQALGIEEMEAQTVDRAIAQLLSRISSGGMEFSNSLWISNGYPIAKEYINLCIEKYASDVGNVDFSDQESLQEIDRYIQEKTHGELEGISSMVDPDTVLLLMNTLYFNGKWELPFDENKTQEQAFYTPDGEVSVSMMHQTERFLYFENDLLSIVSLPYENGETSMAFLLPQEGHTPEEIMAFLAEHSFSDLLSQMEYQEVELSLPRFDFRFESSLIDLLQKLGMEDAFTASADFSGITDSRSLFISQIHQQARITVHETETTASAETHIAMEETSALVSDGVAVFCADRPFLFTIYSNTDGLELFTGVVADPSAQ